LLIAFRFRFIFERLFAPFLSVYFRNFDRVGWWNELPEAPFAPVMVVSAKLHANLDEKKTHVMVRYFELRPGSFFELYVELPLWKAYLEKHPAE